MTRNEFLKNLKEALKSSLDKETVDIKIDYYDKYISDEVSKGRAENEVLEELGDPSLIAKTIKTVTGTEGVVDADEKETKKTKTNKRKTKTFVYSTDSRITIGCVIAFLIAFIFVMLAFRLLGTILIGTAGLAFGFGPFTILFIVILIYLFFGRR